jgi:hypothetical protein
VTGEVTAHHHLYLIRFAAVADGDHGIRNGYLPVGKDVVGEVQELGGQLVEDLAFAGDTFGENHVEGGDAVGSHHHKVATVEEVNVADFSRVLGFLTGKAEISFYNGFHDIEITCKVTAQFSLVQEFYKKLY